MNRAGSDDGRLLCYAVQVHGGSLLNLRKSSEAVTALSVKTAGWREGGKGDVKRVWVGAYVICLCCARSSPSRLAVTGV